MGRGIDSRNRVWNQVAKLHRLAGRYDNPMPTWFLAPVAGLKLPTLSSARAVNFFKNYNSGAATRGLAVGRKQIQATAAPRTITPLETKRSQMVGYLHRVGRVLSFSPVVGIGTPPTPNPQESVPPPLWFWGEGNTCWRERGWESPNSDEEHTLWYSLYLCTLWLFVLAMTSFYFDNIFSHVMRHESNVFVLFELIRDFTTFQKSKGWPIPLARRKCSSPLITNPQYLFW